MDDYRPIGQVAQDCDVTTVQLRDWEKQGLIQCDHRPNGRYFSTGEYDRIRKIRDMLNTARNAGTKKTYDDVRRELFGESLVHRAVEADQQTRIEQMMQHAFDKVFDDEMKQVFLQFAQGYKSVIERNEILERELTEMKQMLVEQSQVSLALDEVAASSQRSLVEMKDILRKENQELRQQLSKREEQRDRQLTEVMREILELKEAQNTKRGWWPFGRK
ncbi:MerR family transcriptional regulator [Alicyclobacillus fodiniaquatilis]|uniref:MerR family transcriptional regulator n=1 Tax=Alicyclobacillus fodiniaquatilis TaxID=1661150 RepID=A0ABW4JLU6_9BACL